MKYTICVDFDGVLHAYDGNYLGEDVIKGEPVPGAIEWLNEVKKKFRVLVLTTRAKTPAGSVAVGLWMLKHGVEGVEVTSAKYPALIYIDDRGFRFEGTFPTAEEIHRALPWWKNNYAPLDAGPGGA